MLSQMYDYLLKMFHKLALTSQLLVEKIKLCIKLGQRVYFALRLSKGVKFRTINIQDILRNEFFYFKWYIFKWGYTLSKFLSFLREIPRKNSRVFYKIPGFFQGFQGINFFQGFFQGFKGFFQGFKGFQGQ